MTVPSADLRADRAADRGRILRQDPLRRANRLLTSPLNPGCENGAHGARAADALFEPAKVDQFHSLIQAITFAATS